MAEHPYPQDYDGPSVLSGMVQHVGRWRREETERQIAEILNRPKPGTAKVHCAKGLEAPEARQEMATLIQAIDQHWDEL